MWVIFEGLDKAGKGTLEWEFLKATNFKHVVIDRGPVGYMVFDKIFDRLNYDGIERFKDQCRQVNKNDSNFMVVYCKANYDVVLKRLEEHKETCPYDYERAQRLYNVLVGMNYDDKKVLRLDTTSKTIDECVELIRKKVEELENEHN